MTRTSWYCSSLVLLLCFAKKSNSSSWTNDEGHDGKYTWDKAKQNEGSTKAIASILLGVADLSTRSLEQKPSPSTAPTQEGQVKGDFLFNPKPKPTSAPTRQPSTTPSRRPSSRPANSVRIISDGDEVIDEDVNEGSKGKKGEGTKSEGKSEKGDAPASTTSADGKITGDFLSQPKPQPIPTPNIQSLPSRQPSNRPISRSNIVGDGGGPDGKNDKTKSAGKSNKGGKEKSEDSEKDEGQLSSANSLDSKVATSPRNEKTSRGESSVELADIFISSGSSTSVIVATLVIGVMMALIGRE